MAVDLVTPLSTDLTVGFRFPKVNACFFILFTMLARPG